jgi:Glycosyltransferase family 87
VFGALHLVPGVLLFALAYKAMRSFRFAQSVTPLALLCTAAGIFEPVALAEHGLNMNDNLLAGFVIAGLLALVRAGTTARPAWPLVWAGVFIGIGAGLKLTLVMYAVAVLVGLPWLAREWGRSVRFGLLFGLGVAAGFLAADGFWMAHLAGKFGNPVFPWYNQFFHSPYWLDQEMVGFDPTLLPLPHKLGERLTHAFLFLKFGRTAMEVPHRDYRFAVAWALLAVAGVAATVRRFRAGERPAPLTAFLTVFALAAFAVWQFKFHILRYLSPIDLLAPLLAVLWLAGLFRGRTAPVLVLGFAACLAMVVGVKVGNYGCKPWGERYFDVTPTQLPVEPDALVLASSLNNAGGLMPTAYLRTLLPVEVPYANIEAIFTADDLPMAAELRERVCRHQGPVYLLCHMGGYERACGRLANFGVRLESDSGIVIEDRWIKAGLWRVRSTFEPRPGRALTGETGWVEGENRALALEDPTGVAVDLDPGPIPRGEYRATVRYRAGLVTGVPATWDVAVAGVQLIWGELPPTVGSATAELAFRIPDGPPQGLSVRVYHNGGGDLVVESVAIRGRRE